jgi:hypothetical protein
MSNYRRPRGTSLTFLRQAITNVPRLSAVRWRDILLSVDSCSQLARSVLAKLFKASAANSKAVWLRRDLRATHAAAHDEIGMPQDFRPSRSRSCSALCTVDDVNSIIGIGVIAHRDTALVGAGGLNRHTRGTGCFSSQQVFASGYLWPSGKLVSRSIRRSLRVALVRATTPKKLASSQQE